jgi:general secretion pathway protein E
MKQHLEDLLIEEGLLSENELREALKVREKTSLRLEQILLKRGTLDEARLLPILARFYGIEYEEHLEFRADELFEKVPLSLIQKSLIVPISRNDRTITVAVSNPADLHPLDDIRKALPGYRIRFVLAPEGEIMRIVNSHYDRTSDAAKEVIAGISEDYSDLVSLAEDVMDLANEAPIIRMVNAILTQGVQERASDIHIEPFEKHLDIRYRVDGVMHRRLSPPKVIHAGLVSRLKIMSHLNIAENRLPQDGRIKIKLQGKDIDIRLSTIPTSYGERIVMRLLNKSETSYSLKTLGMYEDMNRDIERLIAEPNGIFLVTGPTGSGKTTTLYAFLTELNEETRNIITVEDPVEYEMDGISQMQMQDKIGLTFATALRAILRQDPDVIMVGEIRDNETARIAIQASLTGHLVFSTLHTNDAASAVTRLTDMGIEPYLITSTVRGILAQRLVRVICPKCRTPYRPTGAEMKDFGISPSELRDGALFRGAGCDHCVHTGYRGRTGIYELLLMRENLQRAILQGGDADVIKKIALDNGMLTLRDYGRKKVIDGITTVEEVMRVT